MKKTRSPFFRFRFDLSRFELGFYIFSLSFLISVVLSLSLFLFNPLLDLSLYVFNDPNLLFSL